MVELLVVVVLLGLITSFAVLSMGTASIDREMEEEAKRLHALIKLVQEEAIIQAKEMAMEFDKNEYFFLEQSESKWIPIKEKVFQLRALKNELKLTLDLETSTSLFKPEKTDKLRIYFLSSGEQTPFEIKIKIKEREYPYYRLSGTFGGVLKLEQISDPLAS